MAGIIRKKCCNCKELFIPDPRNAKRQKYCRKVQCRKASKAASQRRWLAKPENQGYFCGPKNVKRVQLWREDNPGYRRGKRKTAKDALQDPLMAQDPVLIGLISNFIGSALQDDIAMAARRMQQFGDDILNPQCEGGRHGNQTTHSPRPYP